MTGACGGGGSSTGRKAPARSEPTTHQVSDTDRGATVQAHVGDDIVVTLHSTLLAAGQAGRRHARRRRLPADMQAGGPSCSTVPGSGCGTIRADYRVAEAGNSASPPAGLVRRGHALHRQPGPSGRSASFASPLTSPRRPLRPAAAAGHAWKGAPAAPADGTTSQRRAALVGGRCKPLKVETARCHRRGMRRDTSRRRLRQAEADGEPARSQPADHERVTPGLFG